MSRRESQRRIVVLALNWVLLLGAARALADDFSDQSAVSDPEALFLTLGARSSERWISLKSQTVRFPPADTFATVTVRFPHPVRARLFRFVLDPRLATVSSVTADDELLQDPIDPARTVFPTASGESENFSRALRITLTKNPSASAQSLVMKISYSE